MVRGATDPLARAQESKAVLDRLYKGRPVEIHNEDGMSLVLTEAPQYRMNKKGEEAGVWPMIELWTPTGQARIDPSRPVLNPPMMVPDFLVPQTETINKLGRKSNHKTFKYDPEAALREVLWQSVMLAPNPQGFGTKGTVSTYFAGTTDGYVESSNATYNTMRTGSGLTLNPDGTDGVWIGQGFFTSVYAGDQAFVPWDTSAQSDTDVISAVLVSLFGKTDGTTTNSTIAGYSFDFSGGGTTTADWRTAAQLGALTKICNFATAGFSIAGYNDFTDVAAIAWLNKTGSSYLLFTSEKLVAGTTPTTDESLEVHAADAAGTTNDPKLTVTHAATATAQASLAGGIGLAGGVLAGGRLVR